MLTLNLFSKVSQVSGACDWAHCRALGRKEPKPTVGTCGKISKLFRFKSALNRNFKHDKYSGGSLISVLLSEPFIQVLSGPGPFALKLLRQFPTWRCL